MTQYFGNIDGDGTNHINNFASVMASATAAHSIGTAGFTTFFGDGSNLTGVAGGNTLDQAYDQGGAGAGRNIIADSGAVYIQAGDVAISSIYDNFLDSGGLSISNFQSSDAITNAGCHTALNRPGNLTGLYTGSMEILPEEAVTLSGANITFSSDLSAVGANTSGATLVLLVGDNPADTGQYLVNVISGGSNNIATVTDLSTLLPASFTGTDGDAIVLNSIMLAGNPLTDTTVAIWTDGVNFDTGIELVNSGASEGIRLAGSSVDGMAFNISADYSITALGGGDFAIGGTTSPTTTFVLAAADDTTLANLGGGLFLAPKALNGGANLQTSDYSDTTSTGAVDIQTGNQTGASGDSGRILLDTGNSSNGDSGDITLQTGTAGSNRGNVTISSNNLNVNAAGDVTANSFSGDGSSLTGIVTPSSTDTFTNKTFDANGTGNSISNIDVADLADGTDGELITWDASGNPATVPTGTSGQVLTSNGAGAAPTFQNAATANSYDRTATAVSVQTSGGGIYGVTDTSAARTITLATADTTDGLVIMVKDESGGAATNNITVDTQGAETIDGASSIAISANYGVLRMYSDGTNWFTF